MSSVLPLRPDPRRDPRDAVGGTEPRVDHRRAHRLRAARRRDVGDGQVLGHDVLRRPRALRLHGPRVRAVRARERAATRHVPEHDQVRGRDHRHDARPAARRRGRRRHAGRARHLGRQRQHPPRRALVPRVRAADARHRPAELREARDRPPRVRQGVPPARRRAAAGADRSEDHARSTSTRRRSSSTRTRSR